MAKLNSRTVPRQIEHWAELGRAVEALVDPTALLAIRQGLARLVVEVTPSQPVSSTDVFADLEAARDDGSLPARASEAVARYQVADEPGYLEQIRSDGTKAVGRFRGGRFIPRDEER